MSQQRKGNQSFVKTLPNQLTLVPKNDWPAVQPQPVKVWRSQKYLVQLYPENNSGYPGMMRLSICRSIMQKDGRWKDGLTWDELQAIKREVGFGEWYAVEVYPADQDIVDVANLRHLWLFPTALNIGWFNR